MSKTTKRAKLQIRRERLDLTSFYLRLVAGNGECLMSGESYATHSNAKRGRVDVLNAMIQVLRAEGFIVTAPSRCAHCKKVFDEPSAFEDEDICPKCAAEMAAEGNE